MPITIDTIWFNRILIAAAFFVLGCVSKGRLYHLRAPWYNNRELLEQVPWNVKDAIDFPDSLITARICPSPKDADLRIIQKTTEYSTRLGYNVGPWGYWFYVRASLLLRPPPPPLSLSYWLGIGMRSHRQNHRWINFLAKSWHRIVRHKNKLGLTDLT